MTRRWFEIALPIDTGLVDEAAALLDAHGFGGVEIREKPGRTDVVVVVETDSGEDLAARREAAERAVAVLGAATSRTRELDPKDWTENWKKHFDRRKFAGRIEVRPPWQEASPEQEGLVSIVLNPGMAFGTGLHETTAGCLELLADNVRPGQRVADVGCGSGILAIAAARLGATEVLATDVDPVAIDAARENIRANDVARIVHAELEAQPTGAEPWERAAKEGFDRATQEVPGRNVDKSPTAQTRTSNVEAAGGFRARGDGAFDIVVANILAETLVEMRDSLVAALYHDGTLILSGIEAARLKIVEDAFIRSPLRLGRTLTLGNWVTLALHRKSLAEPEQTASTMGEA